MSQLIFNPTDQEPSTGERKLVPDGDYVGAVKAAEVKATKNSSGSYLEAQIEIVDGECKGDIVYDNFNLVNSNATAVKIGREKLSALCYAMGKLNPISDTAELLSRPFRFKVKVEPESKDPQTGKVYPPKSVVARYYFEKEKKGSAPTTYQPPTGGMAQDPMTIADDSVPF